MPRAIDCTGPPGRLVARLLGPRGKPSPAYDDRVLHPASVDLLQVVTVPCDAPDHLLWLLPPEAPLAWTRGGDGLVGWGVAARVELRGPDRFAQAQAWGIRGFPAIVGEHGDELHLIAQGYCAVDALHARIAALQNLPVPAGTA